MLLGSVNQQFFFSYLFLVGWLVVLRINDDLAIFQPYLDLEAGDNQSLKIQVARPGIEPRSSCSASQELNHSATTAPIYFFLFWGVGGCSVEMGGWRVGGWGWGAGVTYRTQMGRPSIMIATRGRVPE